jgi:hypothetical protein
MGDARWKSPQYQAAGVSTRIAIECATAANYYHHLSRAQVCVLAVMMPHLFMCQILLRIIT